MYTSHVGSFPLEPFRGAEEKILSDLHAIGLDVPPYPQLRSFIDIYLEPLAKKELIEKKGNYYYADPKRLAEEKPPYVDVPEAKATTEVVRSRKLGFKGLRAPITGAFTLASRVYFDNPERGLRATMISKPDVVYTFFKNYVLGVVEYMVRLGYTLIVLDEPILGVIVGKRRILYGHTAESIREVLEEVYEYRGGALGGIHVCGRISSRLFELLVEVNGLKVLNFEFKDTPENLEVISGELLEEYDKVLAPGVASAKKPVVEGYGETLNLLTKIYSKAKGRVDYVSADCGFSGLKGATGDPWEAYQIGLRKLETIVRVVRAFEEKNY